MHHAYAHAGCCSAIQGNSPAGCCCLAYALILPPLCLKIILYETHHSASPPPTWFRHILRLCKGICILLTAPSATCGDDLCSSHQPLIHDPRRRGSLLHSPEQALDKPSRPSAARTVVQSFGSFRPGLISALLCPSLISCSPLTCMLPSRTKQSSHLLLCAVPYFNSL
jgi:hypothetical protein